MAKKAAAIKKARVLGRSKPAVGNNRIEEHFPEEEVKPEVKATKYTPPASFSRKAKKEVNPDDLPLTKENVRLIVPAEVFALSPLEGDKGEAVVNWLHKHRADEAEEYYAGRVTHLTQD